MVKLVERKVNFYDHTNPDGSIVKVKLLTPTDTTGDAPNPITNAMGLQLGENVSIWSFAMIGNNVTIGNNAIIGNRADLKDNVQIGNGCIVYFEAVIGEHARLAIGCLIEAKVIVRPYAQVPKYWHIPEGYIVNADPNGGAPILVQRSQR